MPIRDAFARGDLSKYQNWKAPDSKPDRKLKLVGKEADKDEAGEKNVEKNIAAVNALTSERVLSRHEGEAFHGPEHPENVEADARKIMDLAIQTGYLAKNSAEDIALRVAIPAHDAVVEYVVVKQPYPPNPVQRVRLRGFEDRMPPNVEGFRLQSRSEEGNGSNERELGSAGNGEAVIGNEEKSWLELKRTLEQADPDGKIFTPEVYESAKACIRATYPDAGPALFPEGAIGPEGKIRIENDTVFVEGEDITYAFDSNKDGKLGAFKFDQPLAENSGMAEIATAFGDLLYGLRDDFDTFKRLGNAEFRELNDRSPESPPQPREMQTIGEKIRGGVDNLSNAEKAHIAKLILGWQKTQAGFLLWQKIRFEEILETNETINTPNQKTDMKTFKDGMRAMHASAEKNIIQAAERWRENKEKFGDLVNESAYTESNQDQNFLELLRTMDFVV